MTSPPMPAGGSLAEASGGPAPPPGTLNQLFLDAVARYDRPNALQAKIGGSYHPISHRELDARVRRVASGLAALGVRAGDRVALLSGNRPEWAIADFACLMAGVVDVPIYPVLPEDQIGYMLRDSGAVGIFVSTTGQADKIASLRRSAKVPDLRFVISFEETAGPADITLADLERTEAARETEATIAASRQRALDVRPEDLATIIYTSGTTGEPKGVMLTHDNIHSNVFALRDKIPFDGDDVSLSFLPLSHIFERMGGHYMMIASGTSIAYAESMDTIAANMLEVRPTLVLCVPRVFEKIYDRIVAAAGAAGPVKRAIFRWSLAIGDRWTKEKLAGREPRGLLARKYALARRLVFGSVKERTGGRIRYFISGGAPLSAPLNRFFYGAELTILEGYGLTETSPVISTNTPDQLRIGTVGRPIAGVEVRIAADGEILTRGPHVMKGYYRNPKATSEAIDRDGWFHTGDIGELRDGFLAITDRKKDIIVTAGGKNIAPQPIESRVRANKFVCHAVLIGDKRRFPVLLVVPDFNELQKWAKAEGIGPSDPGALVRSAAARKKMESEIFGDLAGLAGFEMPKKIGLLEHEFSVDRGELTPKQSVKRRVIEARYKSLIDSLYEEE